MNAEVQFNQDQSCDSCGRFGAFDFHDRRLCGACYESSGSCCPEFGCEETTVSDEKGPATR